MQTLARSAAERAIARLHDGWAGYLLLAAGWALLTIAASRLTGAPTVTWLVSVGVALLLIGSVEVWRCVQERAREVERRMVDADLYEREGTESGEWGPWSVAADWGDDRSPS